MLLVVTALFLTVLAGQRFFSRSGAQVAVYLADKDQVVRMDLDDYLLGVLAAEMPASYEPAALMAQAMVARTYLARRLKNSSGWPDPHHKGAAICTDSSHCQGWLSREEMLERWGGDYEFYYARLVQAMRRTEGLILTYEGELAEPVYHANSGGRTEQAADVWGNHIPYLQSVPSPGDRDGTRFFRRLFFAERDLWGRLGLTQAMQPGTAGTGYQHVTTPLLPVIRLVDASPTGRVKTLEVDGRLFSGDDLRRRLDLPSTLFTWKWSGAILVIDAYGFGHGVGLSQQGANAMARSGYSYQAILAHYYPGTRLVRFNME